MIKEIDFKRRRVTIMVGERVIEERPIIDDDLQLSLFSESILSRIPSLDRKKTQTPDFTCQISDSAAHSSRIAL